MKLLILFLLLLGSFLCFQQFTEWALFLTVFGAASLCAFARLPEPEGMIRFDREGKVTSLNHAAKHILGIDGEEAIGRLIHNFRKHPKASEKTKILLISDSSCKHQVEQVGKDFVANASHELRTPITIIKGFAETMQDLPKISEAMLTDFVEKIVRNCERMDSLVKNLLMLTDLEYLPKARLQECDLVALIDNCVHTLMSVHKEVEIETLHNHDIITIFADPDLLELALMNILENGVKYSESPAKITIKIEEQVDKVLLSISDQGVGIPEEDVDHVFDRFYTVNKAHSRRFGGAGLGLSIVKTIMQKHKAAIVISSKHKEGTAFVMDFQKMRPLHNCFR